MEREERGSWRLTGLTRVNLQPRGNLVNLVKNAVSRCARKSSQRERERGELAFDVLLRREEDKLRMKHKYFPTPQNIP